MESQNWQRLIPVRKDVGMEVVKSLIGMQNIRYKKIFLVGLWLFKISYFPF